MEASSALVTTVERAESDRPVFVAASDRRACWLRYGAVTAVLLGVVWLVGLGIGMLSLGQLPRLSLPSFARVDERPTTDPVRAGRHASEYVPGVVARVTPLGNRPVSAHTTEAGRGAQPTRVSRRSSTTARRAKTPARRTLRPTPSPAVDTATPVLPPEPIRQGSSRRGVSRSPGLNRPTRSQAPAPPDPIRRGAAHATTPATIPTEPAAQAATPATPAPSPPPPRQETRAEAPKLKG